MAAIETEGLTRRFGDVVAVEDLSLSVEEGEVFGFLGPNGAGKSTTINVLLGFLDPTDGTARVLGHDVTSDARGARQRIGLLPEGYEPLENLSAREHVQSAIATKDADDDPDDLIARVGLDPDDARRPAGEYSKGMAQRMSLAIALVGEPDLLVLDEPSGGLDPNGVKLLRDIVREEAERGATVFFSSHVLDEVERVCDRVGILHEGRLTAVNTVEDLREDLGAGATIEATVTDRPDLEPLAAVEGVTDVRADGTAIRMQCAREAAKMPALRALDEVTTVTDIQIHGASLEEIFEAYTGGEASATEPDGETPVDSTLKTSAESDAEKPGDATAPEPPAAGQGGD